MNSWPDYISIDQLSDVSGLSVTTLRRRTKDGSLPAIQPGGPRTRLLLRRDVLDTLGQVITPADLALTSAAMKPQQPPATSSSLPGPLPHWQRHHSH